MLQSKRGVRNMIDEFIAHETNEDNTKLWDLKLDKEDVKVFIKKGGS